MSESSGTIPRRIAPDRWPSEVPLFITTIVAAVLIWALLIISVFGIFYAVLFGLFFFVSHIVFVSYLRGSAVRLGPDQFPDLHRRVVDLARAMGMEPPDAYLTQAGGALNAFATRFLGRDIVVLYSDLLEACGDSEGARDMIIAHELAHLSCGHLRWRWLTLPGHFVPFLGGALSRAREYTCDRFGLAGAGNTRDAILGLSILSAGPTFAPSVNVQAFIRQREDTNTGLMTLGEWFASHPPLSKRVAALEPALAGHRFHPGKGRALALAIIAALMVGGTALTVLLASYGSGFAEALEQASDAAAVEAFVPPDVATGSAQVEADFAELSAFIQQEWGAAPLPESMGEIRARWLVRNESVFPTDPFDGYSYGYEKADDAFRLWSSGPDGVAQTGDDLSSESAGR